MKKKKKKEEDVEDRETKVLNSMEQDCLGFPMGKDVPLSRLVLTLGIGDVQRRANRDDGGTIMS